MSYYDNARTDLLERFPAPPRSLLDVGCGAGATGKAAKERWPDVRTLGIEIVAEQAAIARSRLDAVFEGSAEDLDFARAGIHGVDAVLLADVLEHLVDPWSFLKRLKTALAPGATIVASIPNVANLWLIEQLAAGRFEYGDDGLLDRTHLRFFTRASIASLFADAGYRIEALDRVTDGRVDDSTRKRVLGVMLPVPRFGMMIGRRVTVKGVDAAAVEDLRTIGFVVTACDTSPIGVPLR